MRHAPLAKSVPILLAMLTIPAAFGFLLYGYCRAWQFMPEPRGVPSAILVLAIVPGIFAGLGLWCIAELCRAGHAALLRCRVRRGLCWQCGYSQADLAATVCSECGAHPSSPPAHRHLSAGTIALAGGMGLAAIVPGALLAELSITAEDRRFMDEVRRQGGQHAHYRDRAWPHQGFGLVYNPPYGFHVND